MNREKVNKFFSRIPLHAIILFTLLVWIVPTVGLLITSFRSSQAINSTGWWTALAPQVANPSYDTYCAACHGADGKTLPAADLTDPEIIGKVPRSLQLLAVLGRDINGQPHMGELPLPSSQEAADIAVALKQMAGGEGPAARFTASNYVDALVGYRGTRTYAQDCADGTQSPDLTCTSRDFLNPRGMGRAFINSLIVTIPATILPILFAAFAGYAFAWFNFKGRFALSPSW